jgi:hypothetical protein
MKTVNFKKKIEKLSGDFRISAGDSILGQGGQPVVPARAGTLEDVATRYIDNFRGQTATETRFAFQTGKKIKEAAGTVQLNDAEFEFVEKIFSIQIAPVVDTFYSMVEELNPEG